MDLRKIVATVLKQTFQRSSPKKLVYRDYKRELVEKLNQEINEYKHFEQIFSIVPNTHEPIKKIM